MSMFYAKIDTEKKYGWDLTDSSGPPTPPGRKYKSTWNNLKTVKARENRVAHHAEYMMQQEDHAKVKDNVAAKVKDIEALLKTVRVAPKVPLAYRVSDFDHKILQKANPKKLKTPVANAATKLKWEEVTKCKERASDGWLFNKGKQGILGKADDDHDGDNFARIESLLEGTARVGAVAHQNIDKLVNQHGKLEGIVEDMGKHVVRVECDFNAKHNKLREDYEELRAKQENDINDLMAELKKLKVGGKTNRRHG